jgi:tetratricopeptide (TPR) repeat protein
VAQRAETSPQDENQVKYCRSTILSLILPLLVWQSSQDTIRRHYEAAEAARAAGNLTTAETEYTAILAEGYTRLGELLLAQEHPREAVLALEAGNEYQANSSSLLINLAIAYFDVGKYDKAAAVARRVLAFDAQNSGAHQMLGKSYFMLGDVPKAVKELQEASKLTSNDLDVAYTLGIAYLRNRQNTEAKQLFASLVQQFGDRAQLHIIIGRAYRQSGLLSEAAAEFKQAISLDASAPRAHYYLGMTYLLDAGQSKIADAVEEFKLEVEQNPDEFLANYYLGVVYNFQREWQPAIKVLEKAATIEPNNPDPYYQLGQAYQELNQHERAVEVLKKAIAYNPDLGHNKGQVTSAHHRLAQSLLKLGQTEAGKKELQLAADLKAQAFKLEQETTANPSGMTPNVALSESTSDVALRKPVTSTPTQLDPVKAEELKNAINYYKRVVATAHNNVGLLRAERQDFRVAATHFARAINWNPQQEGVAFNLGLAYYKLQLYEQAIAPFEQELKTRPENRVVRTLLGMSCFWAESYPRAADLLTSVAETNPGDLDLQYATATALLRQGKIDAAQPPIERVRANASAVPQSHLLQADAHLSRGETNKALTELSAVNSDSKLIHYYAGLIYLRLKQPDAARKEFERELALNASDVQTKYQLGKLFLSAKSTDKGIVLMREIVQACPEHYGAQYTLGETLLQRRDFSGAIPNLEMAIKLKPENSEAHYQLGQAYLGAGRQSEGQDEIAISNNLKARLPNANN